MIKNLAIGGGSNKLLLIFALALGLLTAILVGVYLSTLDSGSSTSTADSPTTPVVMAALDIPAGTQVTAEMLTVRPIPVELAVLSVFKQTSDVVGQTTQVAILAGEQMAPAKVASAATAVEQYGPTPPLSIIVPDGNRAFSIGINSGTSSGGLVRPGDHVDVLMTTSGGVGASGQNLAASFCYITQDVQVLAIGTTLTQTTGQTDANGIAAVSPDPGASTMTLSVNPSQAGSLAAATSLAGKDGVFVALRNFSDHKPAADVAACDLAAVANPPAAS